MVGLGETAKGEDPKGEDKVQRKGRIKQSVSRWCYQKVELDDLCA